MDGSQHLWSEFVRHADQAPCITPRHPAEPLLVESSHPWKYRFCGMWIRPQPTRLQIDHLYFFYHAWLTFFGSFFGEVAMESFQLLELLLKLWTLFDLVISSGIIISTFFQGYKIGELSRWLLTLPLPSFSCFLVELLASSWGDISVLQMHAFTARVLFLIYFPILDLRLLQSSKELNLHESI